MVERAPREILFKAPRHPYTKALLAAVPEPSLDSRLDLTALMDGKASDPAAWPAPFTVATGAQLKLIDLGDGHYVRAAAGTGAGDIAA